MLVLVYSFRGRTANRTYLRTGFRIRPVTGPSMNAHDIWNLPNELASRSSIITIGLCRTVRERICGTAPSMYASTIRPNYEARLCLLHKHAGVSPPTPPQPAASTSTAPGSIATTSATPLPVFQTRTIKLFCWVLIISKNPFSFPIVEDSTTVDDLKQQIVKEKPNKFVDIDADDLTLWRVSGCSPLSIIICPQLSCKGILPNHRGPKEHSQQSSVSR